MMALAYQAAQRRANTTPSGSASTTAKPSFFPGSAGGKENVTIAIPCVSSKGKVKVCPPPTTLQNPIDLAEDDDLTNVNHSNPDGGGGSGFLGASGPAIDYMPSASAQRRYAQADTGQAVTRVGSCTPRAEQQSTNECAAYAGIVGNAG